eukprot:5103631-Lingulodinium_polyedra.AAC.1
MHTSGQTMSRKRVNPCIVSADRPGVEDALKILAPCIFALLMLQRAKSLHEMPPMRTSNKSGNGHAFWCVSHQRMLSSWRVAKSWKLHASSSGNND